MNIAFHIGPFTEQRIADIKGNRLFFMILGAVRYSDVFKKDRFTVFCYLFNTEHGQFFPCPGGNAAP